MKQGWGITFEAPKWSRQHMNPERASRGGLVRQTLIPRTSSQCDAKNMSGLGHALYVTGTWHVFGHICWFQKWLHEGMFASGREWITHQQIFECHQSRCGCTHVISFPPSCAMSRLSLFTFEPRTWSSWWGVLCVACSSLFLGTGVLSCFQWLA